MGIRLGAFQGETIRKSGQLFKFETTDERGIQH